MFRNRRAIGGHGGTASEALIDLAQFEASNSPDGRLLHYAKGRIRSYPLRQTLTIFGAVSIALLVSVDFGLFLATLALVGEAVDALALRWVIARLEAGRTGGLTAAAALGGAVVQGLSITACVLACWIAIPLAEARFFAACFLISAVINAGLGRPYYPVGADARLGMFTAAGVGAALLDLGRLPGDLQSYGFFAAGFALLGYISVLFIRLYARNYEHRRRHEYALLKHQHAQDLARQELAAAARDSQRLALVARYANDSIIISQPDGRIAWVNDAFTRITGYSYDEAVGRLPGDLLNAPGTDPATLDRIARSLADHQPIRAEILNKTKANTLIWMEISVIPIFDAAGQLDLWIAVERDVTEAKARQEELARARLAAEEAGQSKSRFLANMSHEIRTPMNGVIGMAELLAETPLSPEQASHVGTIQESGRALLDIINDILDLAKLQSGKAVLAREAFSPRACVEGVLRILAPSADKKALSLTLEGEAGLVLGDEGKFRQIALNLVGNAVKFTETGGVRVTLTLPAGVDELLTLEVADTGIGIAPDRIETIFESFSQADNGIGRQFGGTGLGLTICRALAEQMGGGIAVRSQPGHGSFFTLTARLPRTEAAAPVALRPAPDLSLRPGLRILVAEDNRTNMLIVSKMLQAWSATVVEAANGQEAVAEYLARVPDLILMDMSMPVKDGLQATRDIRAHERRLGLPACPILALTANGFGENREACRVAGLDGFLVKPLAKAELFEAINQHCPMPAPPARAIGL